MDLMALLVNNIVKTQFSDLTPEAVEVAKKGILDTVGLILGGSSISGCQLLVQAIKEMGGKEESTIAVFGGKVPPNLAALANCAMSRALDIDDVHDVFVLHPDVVIVPAALAVAECQKGITGRNLITAVALGQDLMVRMGFAAKGKPVNLARLNPYKIFPVTGTVGKLKGLDEEQLLNAMGIAYSHLIGDSKAVRDRAMTFYIQEGEAGRSGVEAVIFAEKGITGSRNILDGELSFFKGIYEQDCNLEALTSELGLRFMGDDIAFKRYCSCRNTHEAINLAIGMVKSGKIDPKRIDKITVRVNKESYGRTCEPLDRKRRPESRLDALFSTPFTVASALLKGDVFIDEMTDENINDPDVLQLAARVTPVQDDQCENGWSVGITVLEIQTKDGQKYSDSQSLPLGNPQNPIGWDECVAKFRKCANVAYKPFTNSQIDELIGKLSVLEDLEDCSQLAQLMVPLTQRQ
jgi:2-methylcitrate dehydratase PrpD